jgi:hypothetical protein
MPEGFLVRVQIMDGAPDVDSACAVASQQRLLHTEFVEYVRRAPHP